MSPYYGCKLCITLRMAEYTKKTSPVQKMLGGRVIHSCMSYYRRTIRLSEAP